MATPSSFVEDKSAPGSFVEDAPVSAKLPQPDDAVATAQTTAQRLMGIARTTWDALNTPAAQAAHTALGTGRTAATVQGLYDQSVAPLVHTLAEPFQNAPLV